MKLVEILRAICQGRSAFCDLRLPWSHDITSLKEVESFGGLVPLLRVGVVGLVVGLLYAMDAPRVVVVSYLIYVLLALIQTLVVGRMPNVVGRRGALLLFAGCFAVGLAFTAGLIQLWLQPEGLFRMLGLLGLMWWMVDGVTARRGDTIMMNAILLAMAVALVALPLVSWLLRDDWREALLLLVTNAVGFGFYLSAVGDIRVMRRSLLQSEVRAFEHAKAEALGRLTGGVAHDFNNLLTVISGNLELMRHIDDPEERRVLRAEAALAASRAAQVTAQLLAFSRRAPIRPERFCVTDSLLELELLMTRLLPSSIAVRLSGYQNLPEVMLDRGQLDAMLLNLCINARDALQAGGNLFIRAMPEVVAADTYYTSAGALPPGSYIRIEIEDDGKGMSPEVLARVFEPYFTTKPKGQGTGMGLAMARGFAEQSGGLLTVQSMEKVGTIATLLLPVAPQVARTAAAEDDRARPQAPAAWNTALR